MTGLAPAGAITASATDIARFMLAHLGDGAIGNRRILRAETAEQMHARAFAHDPRLPGFALGFYEQSTHGLRIIGHGSNTQWFHSDLTLIPSEHLGIFVSYNTDTSHELNGTAFLREFLDHYYPTTPAPPVAGIDQQQQARRRRVPIQPNVPHDIPKGPRIDQPGHDLDCGRQIIADECRADRDDAVGSCRTMAAVHLVVKRVEPLWLEVLRTE